MKIRIGFVSNSSSASFVLHTDFSMQELCDILLKEMSDIFDIKLYLDKMEESIKEMQNEVKKYESKIKEKYNEDEKNFIYQCRLSPVKSKLELYAGVREELRKTNKFSIELLKKIFWIEDYNLNENQMHKASICGWTTMYNDESDFGELFLKVRDMIEEKYGNDKYMIDIDCDG